MSLAVVFGGGGFLGSHVADELTANDFRVRVFDLKPSRFLRDGQEMFIGDITDLDSVRKAMEGAKYVFHFAGLADIDEAADRPRDTVLLNILGTVNLLEAARDAGVERFVFASTVYVYSNAGSFYRASKQACERYVEIFREKFGLPFTILRYGSLYGRRSGRKNTISQLISDALERRTMSYPGDGEELREYIHAQDAAVATLQALGDEYANKHVILTGARAMRVKDVIHMIREMLPFEVDVQFGRREGAEHYRITPYSFNPKIGKKLVVNPFVDMGQGILDCIEEAAADLNLDGEQDG
jgi:UDP-glucose 4-epimerase